MNEHLTQNELDGFLARELEPAALLVADDHLAACSGCRAKLSATVNLPRQIAWLQDEVRPLHLSHAEISAFAEGHLRDAAARAHLRHCALCQEDAEDLKSFVADSPSRAAGRRSLRGVGGALGAAAVFALAAVSLREPPVIREAVPPEWQDLRNRVLRSGVVPIPEEIARTLHPPRATLRGVEEAQSLRPVAPVATATLTAQPEFRWDPEPGADWYRVAIFDRNLRLVVESEHLTETSWRSSKTLAPGEQYLWQITASTQGREAIAPQPPAPEAVFWVLSGAESARLAALAARFSQDHLLLGIVYAQAGALDQAREQLHIAASQGNAEAERLGLALR
ncbi:MAG TPA: hypothetical protein VKU19_25455 [Bryobacteraceae bacterium]|nr:hypothetical protein [Bryobacteraceae bacterium]